MKRPLFAGLLGLAGMVMMASSIQAQTYVYDPVNQQFVLQGSTSTSYYQQAQPNIVQATAQQLLPQYFGQTTYQSYSPYSSSGYYSNGRYYNNGYYNSGYYNNGYTSPYGYGNTGVYISPYGAAYPTGVNGNVYYRGNGRGGRR